MKENVEILGQSMETIDQGLSKIDQGGTTCSANYTKSTHCPKAIPKGIRDTFVKPLDNENSKNLELWKKALRPLPELVKKPVDLKELENVDSCKGNEESLIKDFEDRLKKIKDGQAALKKIVDGGSGEGMSDAYGRLHASTKKFKEDFQKMANACKQEAAGFFGGFISTPASPHEGFIKAFTPDSKFPNCAASVLKGYQSVAEKEKGALAKILSAAKKLESSFSSNAKNLEEAIKLSKERLKKCGSITKSTKDAAVDEAAKKEAEGKETAPPAKEEAAPAKEEAAPTKEECEKIATNPYGNNYVPNSCYRAHGTKQERANNLAKLRNENPEALERALITRDTPESRALSKSLLDEADAYAKSQKPPLPSPKVSARDTVCGESCVAYLRAKSAETSGMDAATVNYLKSKASQTKRQKLQDISL